jgi:hypothetical protein
MIKQARVEKFDRKMEENKVKAQVSIDQEKRKNSSKSIRQRHRRQVDWDEWDELAREEREEKKKRRKN